MRIKIGKEGAKSGIFRMFFLSLSKKINEHYYKNLFLVRNDQLLIQGFNFQLSFFSS